MKHTLTTQNKLTKSVFYGGKESSTEPLGEGSPLDAAVTKHEVFAKQKLLRIILAGLLILCAITVTMTACKEDTADTNNAPETSGKLTVTGIPSNYNGKYIWGQFYTSGGGRFFFAANNVSDTYNVMLDVNTTITAAPINNGTATLKIWEINISNGTLMAFNGDASNLGFCLDVFSKQTISSSEIDDYRLASYDKRMSETYDISFNNGLGSVNLSNTAFWNSY